MDKNLIIVENKVPTVGISKKGEFIFMEGESYVLDKASLRAIAPTDSNDFLEYLDATERLKFANKYFAEERKRRRN